jgi:hypothetical protein
MRLQGATPTTPRMRVRTGRFRRIGKATLERRLQSWLRHRPPEPLHLVRCNATAEVCAAHALPTVRAFTLSHPLRWAFGYYALC